MTADDFLLAARVPASVPSQERGLWTISRQRVVSEMGWSSIKAIGLGRPDFTILSRWTDATIYTGHGEIVMEDSNRELRKHLPIWMAARGHVLKTGLGLGCVVRGLLASPDVDHVTCIEIDADVLAMVGPEFAGNSRVTIIHADALEWEPPPGVRFDFAWHDIWCEGNQGLQLLHMELAARLRNRCGPQGAWDFPREFKRLVGRQMEWIG